jgi:uncharacterized protein YciI
MTRLFAVIRQRGPAWDDSIPLPDLPGFRAHSDFVTAMEAEGFLVLGGPLEGTDKALLVIRAPDEAAIRARLAEDPWGEDYLVLAGIHPWNLRFGTLPG